MPETLFKAVGVVLALAGCTQSEVTGAQRSPAGSYPSDTALSCPEIMHEITHENMIIKEANGASAPATSTSVLNQGGNGSPVPQTEGAGAAFAPTSAAETPAQLAADQTGTGAVARANALVALGRQKKCFL